MKFYLSSYKLGNNPDKLKQMVPKGKIGYILNALDFSWADPVRRQESIDKDVASLRQLGFEIEVIDLRDYFQQSDKLRDKINALAAIFVRGGNAFVLRQAMKLSGLDKLLKEMSKDGDFLYSGDSAGGCVLSPSLKGYEIVDQIDLPYEEIKEVIWDGLGLIDYCFMPHWDSDHPEAADVRKQVEYCKQNNIPYKTVRDGEVIIIE